MSETHYLNVIIPIALFFYYQLSPAYGLSALADQKLAFLKAGGWSHDLPDCSFHCQRKKYAPGLTWLGENLAKGQGSDWCTKEGIYKHWQSSSIHKNILDEQNIRFEVFKLEQVGTTCYAVLERGK